MKKGIFVIGFWAIVLTGAWAQSNEIFSIGFGGFAGGDLGGGVKTSIIGNDYEMSTNMGHFGGGAFVFIDAKYLEVSLGYFMGSGNWEIKTNAPGISNEKVGELLLSSLNIGLLLKYPVAINSKLKLFPALGVNYQAVLSAKLDGTEIDHPDDLSAVWFQFGGGLDWNFSQKLYLRFEALYGIRTKTNMEEDYVDYLDYSFSGYQVKNKEILGQGPSIKIALGINL